MFDIGWSELLIVAAVALLVIGPKELPATLRTLGQWAARVRRMASDFQDQFREAMREADVADLKKDFDSMKEDASLSFAAVGNIKNEIETSFAEATADKPAAEPSTATSEPAAETASTEPAAITEQPAPAAEPDTTASQPEPAVADAVPAADGKQPA